MNVRSNVDYTSRDYEGFRNDMIALLKTKIPEYSDFSESDMGIVLIELLAHGLDIVSFYNDKVANEIFPDTATERESVIKHCRRLGYELKNSTPSKFKQVFKIIPQEVDYVIPRGMKITTSADDDILVEFEVTEDLLIPKGCNGLEQDESGNYLYTVEIEQGTSVNSDIIGSSNGTPYQEFMLSYAPVILDSLRVTVASELDIEDWERVDNFIDSDQSSKQYMVEVTENDYVKILFGSGVSGMIPPPFDNGISATYRIGGGSQGNVSLNTITEMPSRPAVILDTFNVEQIQLGKDKETIEEATVNATLSLRTLWRAVCLEDYENLLYQEFATDILQCKAKAEDDRFTISLYVLTNDPKEDLPEDQKQKYLEFLDERKEIGYDLKMYPPSYEEVTLTITAKTTKAYENETIKGVIESFVLNEYDKGIMKFGEELLLSKLTMSLMSLQGIIDVNIEHTGNLKPNATSIVKVTTVTANVTGGV